jgi:hypothetical protein
MLQWDEAAPRPPEIKSHYDNMHGSAKMNFRLLAAERPEGILEKTPGNGIGKGNDGETETTLLRGKCNVSCKNFEKGVLVRKTETTKSEHHLAKDSSSTAGPD